MKPFEVNDWSEGLVLVRPADRPLAGSLLQAQNLNGDRVNICSRAGMDGVGYSFSGPVLSLGRRSSGGVSRYAQVGGDVHKDGGGTAYASGFAADWPISYVNAGGYMYMCNPGAQKRDNGTVYDWLPTAPAGAPALAKLSRVSVTCVDFSAGPDQTWQRIDNATGASGASSDITYGTGSPGSYMQIAVPDDQLFQSILNFTPDRNYRIDGLEAAGDVFRLAISISDPSTVEYIDIAMGAGFVDPDNNYFSVRVGAEKLQQIAAGSEWFSLEIQRSADPGLADPPLAFSRQGSSPTQSWNTISSIAVAVKASAAVQVRLADWTVYGGISAPLDGEYSYFFTYEDSSGTESPAGPTSSLRTERHPLQVTRVAPPSWVVRQHVYRFGGTQQAVYRVWTFTDASLVFVDQVGEDTAAGNVVWTNSTVAAPAGMNGCALGNSQILVYGGTIPNRAILSKAGAYSSFPPSNEALIGDDDEQILYARFQQGSWKLAKARSFWCVDSWPGGVRCTSTRGIVGPRAIAHGGGSVDYFISHDGVYAGTLDGDGKKLSTALDPIFLGDDVDLGTTTAQGMNRDASARFTSWLVFTGDRIIVGYPAGSSSTPNAVLVYHMASDRWVSLQAPTAIRCGLWEGTDGEVLFGGEDGRVLSDRIGGDDDGTAIEWIAQTPFYDLGDPDTEKLVNLITIRHNQRGGTATVKILVDDGAAEYAVGTLSGSEWTTQRWAIGTPGGATALEKAFAQGRRNISFLFEGMAVSGGVAEVAAVKIWWQPAARKTLAWDTATIGVSPMRWRSLKLDIENAGAVDGAVHSDVSTTFPLTGTPGIDQRQAVALAETGNRRTVLLPHGAVLGEVFRVHIGSPDVFRLYRVQALVRDIQHFISPRDGARGGAYIETPLLTNFEAFEIRRLGVVYEAPGGQVNIQQYEADFNSAIAAVGTPLVLPLTQAETLRWLPIDATTGVSWRLRFIPTSGLALYAVLAEMRQVGQRFSGATGAGYDSGWIGDGNEVEVSALEIDISNSADVVITLTPDTGTPVQVTIPPGGRRPLSQFLTTRFTARRFKVTAASGAIFTIFGFALTALRFGTVTTAAGWTFEPQLIGGGQTALFTEVEIDAQVIGGGSSSVTVSLSTDLSVTQNKNLSIAGHQVPKYLLPDGVFGRSWSFAVSSVERTVIRRLRVRARIGSSFTWLDVPVQPTPAAPSTMKLLEFGDRPWSERTILESQSADRWMEINVDE